MRTSPAMDPRIVAGSDYGNPDPAAPGSTGASHLHRVELPGAEVNYVEIFLARASRSSSSTASPAAGTTGWKTSPTSAANRRAIALDLPGFGASPMPSWEIEMPAYGRAAQRLLREARDRAGATLVGNSMGGFVARRGGERRSRSASSRLVLVSAAGIINTWNPEERATVTALAWKHFGPRFANHGRQIVCAGHAVRQIVFGPFVRYPGRLREDLLLRADRRRARAGRRLRARRCVR